MGKINELSTGEKMVAAAGILLFVVSFAFPWYDVEPISATFNGWERPGSLWSILAALVGLALAGAVLAPRFGNVQLPPPPNNVTMGQIFLGGGALVLAFLILKLLNESGYIGIGFVFGFMCAEALAFGGYLIYSEERTGVRR